MQEENQIEQALNTVDEGTGAPVNATQVPAAPVAQTPPPAGGYVFDADQYMQIKGLIQNHLDKIDKVKGQLTEHKGMLNDMLMSDKIYQEHVEKSDKASKERNAIKQQLLKAPAAQTLVNKVKDLSMEMKESRAAISDYLLQYQQISGVNEIEDSTGETREILLNAKIKGR